jgi:N6-adenosine-specific RNA methylase IME4
MTAYSCIVADPPWAPRDKLPGKTRGAAKQYDVMRTSDIMCFLVDRKISVADNAILFLWRLASMQQDALDVVNAWGFEVKSEVVWRKLTKHGRPHFGMGRYVRNGHEVCLIAARGRATSLITSHSVRSVFDAVAPSNSKGRAIHSQKPEEFWTEIVEPLTTGYGIELFARRRRFGWDAIGDQLPALEAA